MNSLYDGLPPLSVDTIEDYLAPWLDGVLEPDLANKVKEIVQQDDALSALVAKMQGQDTALAEGFNALIQSPIPVPLYRAAMEEAPKQAKNPTRRATILKMAASFAAGAVGLGFVGYQLGNKVGAQRSEAVLQSRFSWVAQVVGYQNLYAAEQRHIVAVKADETAHLQTWLGERLGTKLTVPDMSDLGLEFLGGRMLAVHGQPVAQLMYASTDGQIVGLCALRGKSTDEAFRRGEYDQTSYVKWRRGGYDMIVVGDAPTQLLERAARKADGVLL